MLCAASHEAQPPPALSGSCSPTRLPSPQPRPGQPQLDPGTASASLHAVASRGAGLPEGERGVQLTLLACPSCEEGSVGFWGGLQPILQGVYVGGRGADPWLLPGELLVFPGGFWMGDDAGPSLCSGTSPAVLSIGAQGLPATEMSPVGG